MRNGLRTCWAVGLLLIIGGKFGSALVADDRPNIVFAFADDWGRYASAYAKLEPGGISDVVHTPNFDRIAANGVLFTQAYVNAPSCTPCRSSILSGQFFWRTGRGAILQGAIWDDQIPSYPLLLEQSGYAIGYTYKVWGPGTPAHAPYGAKRTAFNKSGQKFNRFSQVVANAANPEQAKSDLMDEVRGNFTSFLESRGDGQPFCYWFGPTNCHRTWVKGSGKDHWGLDPDSLKGKIPDYLPDNEVVRQDFCDYLGEVQAFDAGLGVLLDELDRRDLTKNTIVVVSGDHGIPGVPRGKCNLYDLGTRVSLAISWPGKTGMGHVVDDFVCLPDLAPTFLDVGEVEKPDVMTARSLMEVLTAGKSGRVDPARDHVIVGRERHVAQARQGRLPFPERAIRTEDFLYIRTFKPDRYPMGNAPGFGLSTDVPWPKYDELEQKTVVAFGDLDASPIKAWMLTNLDQAEVRRQVDLTFGLRPKEQLFAIQRDPDCLVNLAEDPRYEDVRRRLADRLLSTLRETGDPRVVNDGQQYDLPPFAGD